MSIDNIEDLTPRVQYVADVDQTDFDYPFPINAEGDIAVDIDGAPLTLTTDFTVAGEGDDLGGTITLLAACSGGETVTLWRDTEIFRTTDFQQNGGLTSASINDELDRLTLIAQEQRDGTQRSLRLPRTTLALAADTELDVASWAGKYVTIDADGLPAPAVMGDEAITAGIIGSLTNAITAAEISAGVTSVDETIPSHLTLGYVLATRYGLSTTAPGSTNYAALAKAHAVAVTTGCALHVPAGTFDYTPTAVLYITQPFVSFGTFDCDMSSYSGVVFQQTGSGYIRGLSGTCSLAKVGTFIKQEPLVIGEFTGHQTLDHCSAVGFGKNIDIGNTFHNVYNKCRFTYGAIGVNCVPSSALGDGYVTVHTWIDPEIFGNDQNVVYQSTLQSRGVHFLSSSDEGATRLTASTFTRIRGLVFTNFYAEGTSTKKALILNDCTVEFQGQTYLNGTAGITLGTNTVAKFGHVAVGTSTDVLTGGDGTQIITMDGSSWPASGNSPLTDWLDVTAVNSSYNGVTYRAFFTNLSTGFTDDGYSASITPSLRYGNTLRYTVNNGTAFTVNAPINMGTGSMLRIILKNTSGGVIGTITWNAAFKLPSLTLPATGFNRTYTFQYDGTNWIFLYQTSADVPN